MSDAPDGGRPAALLLLRKHLDSLTELARVSWWRLGPYRTALQRRDWPPGAADRALRWAELLELFAADGRALVAEVWPEGVPQTRATLFDLPASQLTFAERPASGERPGENEIPALSRLLAGRSEGEDCGPPPGVSEDCGRDVLRLLFALQERRTLEQLVEEFARSERLYSWSRSSVAAACAYLRNTIGVIDSRRDGKGHGYGLLHWQSDPCQD